jgi:hypothetical protein
MFQKFATNLRRNRRFVLLFPIPKLKKKRRRNSEEEIEGLGVCLLTDPDKQAVCGSIHLIQAKKKKKTSTTNASKQNLGVLRKLETRSEEAH